MRAYVTTEPHARAMTRLDHWCDEATFVDWEQDTAELPDWQTGYRHVVADGRSAPLTNPSPSNETRDFPRPVAAS
jgi:hypothetical protein